MNRYTPSILCLVTVFLTLNAQGQEKAVSLESRYVPVIQYDPKRDAGSDIKNAVIEAQRTGKHILLEVGGEWCTWCHILDKFFEQNRPLAELREKNFITVKVSYSPENKNQKVLSRYPTIPGYPHLFVLDQNGKLLHSQDTSKLESGKSYNLKGVTSFLRRWAPQSRGESSMPHGGTTKDENHSPPREGRRGGLSRTGGPTPKATPSAPPQRRFS